MFMKKMAAFLTGAVVLALALPVLVSAQAPEKTADATQPAAQEAAEEPEQPAKTREAVDQEASQAPESTPENTPEAQRTEPPKNQDVLSIYVDGKDVTGGAVTLNWPDQTQTAPTALLKAVGPGGENVSPLYEISDDAVANVDPSGFVTAIGYGVATITATLDTQKAELQISVGQEIQRVVIIGSDTVPHGRSIKLRAFDQDGNRIQAVWRSSSDKIASVSPDGVVTASRGASGQTVDVTALADEGSGVYAVKTIRIE
jgi:hypothetical protein